MAAPTLRLRRGSGAPGITTAAIAEPFFDTGGNLYVATASNAFAHIGGSTYTSRVDEFLTAVSAESSDGAADGSNANIAITSQDITGSAVNLSVPDDVGSSYTLTFPSALPGSAGNYFLQIDQASGDMSFVAAGSGAASQVSTVTSDTDASFLLTFVDSNNTSAGDESVFTDAELSYNPNTDSFNIGDATTSSETGTLSLGGQTILAQAAGVVTLSNVDVLDATTEGTIETAIDTLTNLTEVGTISTGTWSADFGDALIQDLADITGTASAADQFIVSTASGVFALEDAATARGSLGVDAAGTDNSTDVTLVTTAADYLSIDGSQVITLAQIDLANDVTGTLPVGNGGTGVTSLADNAVLTGGTTITAETNLTFNGTTLAVTGAATVDNLSLDGNTITTSSGNLTLDSADGTVSVSDNLTVTGNLNVQGTTTTVNTTSVLIEDPLQELGLTDSGGSLVAPTAATSGDRGLKLHYHDGVAAFEAYMIFDASTQRMVFAVDGSDTSNEVTVADANYATVHAKGLYVTHQNDAGDTAVGNVVTIAALGEDETEAEGLFTAGNGVAGVYLLNTTIDCGSY